MVGMVYDPTKLFKMIKDLIRDRRKHYTGRTDQAIIKEFITISKHDLMKNKIAKELKEAGKNVLIEKYLVLEGVRFRADIAYFENGRWNFVEVQDRFGNKNNILKNFNKLSKVANIKVIYF